MSLIGLSLLPAVTPRRLRRLVERLGGAAAVWEAAPRRLSEALGECSAAGEIAAQRGRVDPESVVRSALCEGIRLVTLADANYPSRLRALDRPPIVLSIRGDPEALDAPSVAVVGTRRASGYGRAVARRLAEDLVDAGIVVVSGLAAGVDTAAHRAAVSRGGTTVAALGCGLRHRLPGWQQGLAELVVEHGALISEFPLTMPPERWTFPQRNRILAALAKAVIVVEAPARSGALITADWALHLGRDVFAVPGNITSRSSEGCNALLKDGALLLTSIQDVLLALGARRLTERPRAGRAADDLSPRERAVYEQIGLEAVHIDDIIATSGLSPAEAAHILLVLEMKELICALEGKRFLRAP